MDDFRIFLQEQVSELAFVKVGFDDSIMKSKLLDSISVVSLLVAIEEHIGKQIPQYLINEDNFDTINKISETIASMEVSP